jgi:hypothetical protein
MKRVLIALPLIAIAGAYDLESVLVAVGILLLWPVKARLLPR